MELRGSLRDWQISPVFTALPLGLLGSVILFDLGVMLSGGAFFAEVSYWVLSAALMVCLLVATGLLVHVTCGPLGPAARRTSGVVSASMTGTVVAFALVWWLRTDGSAGVNVGTFLIELAAFGVGVAGASYGRGGTRAEPSSGLAFLSVLR